MLKFLVFLLILNQTWATDFREIEGRLAAEEIVFQIPMEEFLRSKGHRANLSSPVYLVELARGLKAVLKLVDSNWPRDAISEVAAYKASEFLGLHLVPPTVLYTRGGLIGSLQYYVEPSFDLMVDANYGMALKRASLEDLASIELFYFIMGQWDPGRANLIAVETGGSVRFALIDNAAMGYTQKARYGEYPFVLCFPEIEFPGGSDEEAFPFDAIQQLTTDVWEKEYGTLLLPTQVSQVCRLQRPIAFVIWKGQFWRQYRFGNVSYTNFYPSGLMQKIAALTRAQLQEFYANDFGFSFSNHFFDDVLERRDQVLAAANAVKLRSNHLNTKQK